MVFWLHDESNDAVRRCVHLAVRCALFTAAFGLVSSAHTVSAQQQDDPLNATLRVGFEYDDNPLRLQDGDPRIESTDPAFSFYDARPDFLARYFGSLDWRDAVADRGRVSVGLRHGGKLYLDKSQADALLTQATLSYRHRALDWLYGQLAADVKDRTERYSRFDYNRGGARAVLGLAFGRWRAQASGGWRYFAYKPAPSLSSHGPQLRSGLRRYIGENWAVGTNYTLSLRRFQRPISEENVLNTEPRRDLFHTVDVGIDYRGAIIADVSYVLSINRSSIETQRLTRHRADISLTTPIVWELYATLHAELQRTVTAPEFRPDALFFVDEENRNVFVASIARPFGGNWEVEGRYSLYLEEFSDSAAGDENVELSYSRQTFLLAVGYSFD